MPQDAPVTVVVGQLPEGYCFTSWQQLLVDIFNVVSFFLTGNYIVWNYGNTTPAANDRNKPWKRTNLDGSPDRDYIYFGGGSPPSWVSPHPIAANDKEVRMWQGSANGLKFKDGGEDAAVTPTTGPFWEIATDMAARVPLGVGTLGTSGLAVAVNQTGGDDAHTLLIAELPSHAHAITNLGDVVTGTGGTNIGGFQGSGTPIADLNTGTTGSGNPVNVMNPYLGIYFIKRTARSFYSIPG